MIVINNFIIDSKLNKMQIYLPRLLILTENINESRENYCNMLNIYKYSHHTLNHLSYSQCTFIPGSIDKLNLYIDFPSHNM